MLGVSALSICTECGQRVVVDGAANKRIPIILGVPQGSALSRVIQYTRETFERVKNRLFAYADDSTLLAVVISQQKDLLLLPPLTGTWQVS